MGTGLECGDYLPPLDATCAAPWQVIITFESEEEDA